MESYTENNHAQVVGEVYDEPKFSHEVYGEKFYIFTLSIPRLSGASDLIKVMISERLLPDTDISVGDIIEVSGQFRSYNDYEDGGNRLVLTVFAKDIRRTDDGSGKNPNSLYLNGFICKEPVYRTTPFGREITDLLLAVNRSYNKSDYIPVIAWGRNARYVNGLSVGDRIAVQGRIQSREYQKTMEDGGVITKTAYEVSIARVTGVTGEIIKQAN